MDHRAYEGSVGMLNTPYVKKDTIKNFFHICWASCTLLVRRFPTTRRNPHIG